METGEVRGLRLSIDNRSGTARFRRRIGAQYRRHNVSGLIELHNHLAYNALRLWQVPKKYNNASAVRNPRISEARDPARIGLPLEVRTCWVSSRSPGSSRSKSGEWRDLTSSRWQLGLPQRFSAGDRCSALSRRESRARWHLTRSQTTRRRVCDREAFLINAAHK